jgi:hypothetical protein
MIRQKLMAHQHEKGFRWRGGEIARIEGLSDAVFAFAVTLLVVSLEVPRTFNELKGVMRGFFAFAVCFVLLLQVWHEQYRYFRRYNLQDSISTVLNCVLLFLVLFYVYPLKFLFTFLLNGWMGFGSRVQLPNGSWENVIEAHQLPQLMSIFSGGFLAVACIFILLFTHALRKHAELDLNALEVYDTKVSIGAAAINAFTALISLAIAFFGSVGTSGFAGLIYPILLGPGFSIYYTIVGRKRRRFLTAAQAA